MAALEVQAIDDGDLDEGGGVEMGEVEACRKMLWKFNRLGQRARTD